MIPIPNSVITTPYGKKGIMWSDGVHKGVDYKGSAGTKVYAPWGGKIIGIGTWGAAFGSRSPVIDFDRLPNGNAGLWGVLAHLETCAVKVGDVVSAGQYIGTVGSRGNSTGPHLHFEVQKSANWSSTGHTNPQPWIDAGAPDATGYKYTSSIYSNKLGFGEPTNGDTSSDTVKELQYLLNGIKLTGGQTLAITGNYDEDTDEEVRLWQEQICGDTPDPVNKSYLGKNQREKMFSSSAYSIIDNGLPYIAGEAPPTTGTSLGTYLKSEGFKVNDTNVPMSRDATWDKVKFILIHHTGSPDTNTPESDVDWIKTGNEFAPLAQLYVDHGSTIWTCCQQRAGHSEPGRASQAGRGSGYGVPVDSMNRYSLGIEFKGDGSKPLSSYPEMYATGIKLIASLCRRYNVPVENVIGHKEWSSTGKVDPLDDMNVIRQQVAAELNPEPESGDNMGIWTEYSGKPGGTKRVTEADEWVKMDFSVPATPYTGSEHHLMYARVNFGWKSGNGMAKVECKYVRSNGDETAFDERHYEHGTKSVPFQQKHFEDGEKGVGGNWYMKIHGGASFMELTTRYCKTHVYYIAKEQ